MRRRKLPKDTRYRRVKQVVRELDRLSLPQESGIVPVLHWKWANAAFTFSRKRLEIAQELVERYGVDCVTGRLIKPYPGDERYFTTRYTLKTVKGKEVKNKESLYSIQYLNKFEDEYEIAEQQKYVSFDHTCMIDFEYRGNPRRPLTMEEQQERENLLIELKHISRKDYKRYRYYKNK